MNIQSPEEVVKHINSDSNIFIHSVAAAPNSLINAMTNRASELRNVNIYQLHTEGKAPYSLPEHKDAFHINALFIGANVRKAVNESRASYVPAFLSEIPLLFRGRFIDLDTVLISVSPPDKHGYCSLGPSVDATLAAVESAKIVIAQVNNHLPRVHGEGIIHVDKIDYLCESHYPLEEIHPPKISQIHQKIGAHISNIIEDGSTLQLGIGAIPNAVLSQLENHKELGIHTEMFSDGVIPLVEQGVITGSQKKSHARKIVSSFVMGTKKIYDFIDENPSVILLDSAYVNSVVEICKNPKVVAINSAVEIDLTGQVCADSIGDYMYSGVGGQMDFIRGASLSEGGKPIIAIPSTTKKGESRIVNHLKPGAGVVTTRAHVHYVATEFGIVNLYGKSLKERAKLLISIAHPNHREQLSNEAFERFGISY